MTPITTTATTTTTSSSPTTTNPTYAPDRLLATLAGWFNASSDHELAKRLQISPQVLRGIRSGHIAVSPSLLILMAESAGTAVSELRALLGERRRKARMTCYSKRSARPMDA